MSRAHVRFSLALLLTLGAVQAHAAEPEKGQIGRYIDLSSTALPIVWQGRLVNYVFVRLRLNLAPGADALSNRAKAPYFRDALVRYAHRRPFTRPDDFTKVNLDAVRAAMMQEAARVAGPHVIASVQVLGEAKPQRITGLPHPSPPGRALIP